MVRIHSLYLLPFDLNISISNIFHNHQDHQDPQLGQENNISKEYNTFRVQDYVMPDIHIEEVRHILFKLQNLQLSMSNLFQGNSLFPVLTALLSSILYAGLFNFGYSRIIERLYAWSKGSKLFKVQLYLFLINSPIIMMILSSTVVNGNLLAVDIALELDEINILLVSGYICFLQESRHTPIRGFVFVKDVMLVLISLGLYIVLQTATQNSSIFIATIIILYLTNIIIQAYTNQLENSVLLALGVREKNVYKAVFLLTEKSQSANFLDIKDIVSSHQEKIDQEIDDFVAVATRLKKTNEDLQTLTNLARLFLPIKAACQIQEEIAKKKSEEQYVQNWNRIKADLTAESDNYMDEDDGDRPQSFNHSASTLFIKKTITTDSIFDIQDHEIKEQNESLVYKAIKYICYPIYLSSQITGRARYFMDYLIIVMIGITMYLLGNSISYFSELFPTNQNIITLIFSGLLFYPVAGYFMRISQGSNDYDFIGIFMHSIINKMFLLSIGIILRNIIFGEIVMGGTLASMLSLGVRIGTYLAFGAYLSWIRFATRFSNFKVFIKIFVFSQIVKILSENLINYIK